MSCLDDSCIVTDLIYDDFSEAKKAKLEDKEYDPVTFDLLKVKPEDFASQITLVALEYFQKISADELSLCGWLRKDKEILAPNILQFTYKFNVICLWTQSSVLDGLEVHRRAQLIGHFIKVAKFLLQLNNIYSAFAVVSALLSQPIYRLSKTWMLVNRREKSTFLKLTRLFKEDNNFEMLRKFTNTRKLPCIPFLGLYLTDIAYCTAVKKKDSQQAYQQEQNINGILRSIASFQDSNYDHLPRIFCVQKYIESVEFQKEFLSISEGELKSINREPQSSSKNPLSPKRYFSLPRWSILNGSSRGGTPSLSKLPKENQSPNAKVREKSPKIKIKPLTPNLTQASKSGRFVKGHKKANSVGNEAMIMGVDNPIFLSVAPDSSPPIVNSDDSVDRILNAQTNFQPSNINISTEKPLDLSDISDLMFDSTISSSILETSARSDIDVSDGILELEKIDLNTTPKKNRTNSESTRTPRSLRKMMSLKSIRLSENFGKRPKSEEKRRKMSVDNSDVPLLYEVEKIEPEIQGVVHRCVIRGPKSKEVLLKYSQRYYLELRQGKLYEFEKRPLVFYCNSERDLYKLKPRRVIQLKDNWEVIRGDEEEPNFELHQPKTGRIVRYRCKSLAMANEWYRKLLHTTKEDVSTMLIHF